MLAGALPFNRLSDERNDIPLQLMLGEISGLAKAAMARKPGKYR